MKIVGNFLLLVESFAMDEMQRVSLINMYDVIYAPSLPAMHPKLLYVANFRVTDNGNTEELNVELTLKDKTGEEIIPPMTGKSKIDKNRDLQLVGARFEVAFVGFKEYGIHTATLKVNGEEVMNHLLEVKQELPAEA